jgi:hypothetical protein
MWSPHTWICNCQQNIYDTSYEWQVWATSQKLKVKMYRFEIIWNASENQQGGDNRKKIFSYDNEHKRVSWPDFLLCSLVCQSVDTLDPCREYLMDYPRQVNHNYLLVIIRICFSVVASFVMWVSMVNMFTILHVACRKLNWCYRV